MFSCPHSSIPLVYESVLTRRSSLGLWLTVVTAVVCTACGPSTPPTAPIDRAKIRTELVEKINEASAIRKRLADSILDAETIGAQERLLHEKRLISSSKCNPVTDETTSDATLQALRAQLQCELAASNALSARFDQDRNPEVKRLQLEIEMHQVLGQLTELHADGEQAEAKVMALKQRYRDLQSQIADLDLARATRSANRLNQIDGKTGYYDLVSDLPKNSPVAFIASFSLGYAGTRANKVWMNGVGWGLSAGFSYSHMAVLGFLDSLSFKVGESCGWLGCDSVNITTYGGGIELAGYGLVGPISLLGGAKFGTGFIAIPESTGSYQRNAYPYGVILAPHIEVGYRNIAGLDFSGAFAATLPYFTVGAFLRAESVLELLVRR